MQRKEKLKNKNKLIKKHKDSQSQKEDIDKMAIKFDMQILGKKEVEKMLKEKAAEVVVRADEAITKATLFIEGEVKASVAGQRAEQMSVDTGQFLNSIKGRKSGTMEGVVFSDVEHSKFMEYGTSKIRPRSHFRNSLARNQNKIKEFVLEEIKKIEN
jgi:hypothetical protein